MAKNKYIETPEIKCPDLEFELPFSKVDGGYKVLPNTKFIGGKNCLRDIAAKKTRVGFVYFINLIGTNKYKIGVSTNPKRRLADIASIIPFDINVLAINELKDPYKIEQELINKFKHKLIKNEWFDLDVNDGLYIMVYLHNKQVDQLT